jgi:hypothetical protein
MERLGTIERVGYYCERMDWVPELRRGKSPLSTVTLDDPDQ